MQVGMALLIASRVTFVLGVALLAAFGLGRVSASVRRWVLLLGLGGALCVPLLALPLQGRAALRVATPVSARVVAEALSRPSALASANAPRRASSAPTGPALSWANWLAASWALGVLVCALRLLVSHSRARGVARRALRHGSLRYSRELESPVVIGVWRPTIVLPEAARGWSEERLRAVLLHEGAHVQQRDGLALLVARVACAVYWPQPLAWLALRQLRRECELSADEAVLSAGLRASSYAEHLLAIARASTLPAHGIAMAARPSELGRRIRVLVSRSTLPAPLTPRRAGWLAAGAALVLAVVACTEGARAPESSSTASATRTSPREPALQRIAEDEARRVHDEWGAERVAILLLEPRTGRIVASVDDAPNQPVVPASTLKPLTVAVALDGGTITTEQRFDCSNGARSYGADLTLRDAGQYGLLDAGEILAVSSNIGVSRIFDLLGSARLGNGLRSFGVGVPADIPDGTLRGALVAIGEGSTTTPAALAAAYGVLANDGLLANEAGSKRVIRSETARSVRTMLEGVVSGERATGTAARVPGIRLGGKTGTSDEPDCEACVHSPGTFASFVGIVPLDEPRWVIYVGVGKPRREGSGGTIAAPAFARVAARALASNR